MHSRRYSWRENLTEADMLIQSALLTFDDWRSRESGELLLGQSRAAETNYRKFMLPPDTQYSMIHIFRKEVIY